MLYSIHESEPDNEWFLHVSSEIRVRCFFSIGLKIAEVRKSAIKDDHDRDRHSTGFVEEPKYCCYVLQYQRFTAIYFIGALKFFLAASPNRGYPYPSFVKGALCRF